MDCLALMQTIKPNHIVPLLYCSSRYLFFTEVKNEHAFVQSKVACFYFKAD